MRRHWCALSPGLADTLAAVSRACRVTPRRTLPLRELHRLFRDDVHGHELVGRLRLAAVPRNSSLARGTGRLPATRIGRTGLNA
jgi:hypothetical protein